MFTRAHSTTSSVFSDMKITTTTSELKSLLLLFSKLDKQPEIMHRIDILGQFCETMDPEPVWQIASCRLLLYLP